MKVCRKCKKLKSLTAFYRRKDSRDGHRSHCVECISAKYQAGYIPKVRKTAMTNAERNQKYRERHPGRSTVQHRKWCQKNRGYVNAANSNRRVKTTSDDPRVYAVYEIAAWLRTVGDDVHVDHIIPLSRGGSHTFDNLQILSAAGNRKKSARLPTPEELARCSLLHVTGDDARNWI